MGSGVIFYEYEKREKFEDHDMRADAELGTYKIRRYHFDNEFFVHPLHSVRFDPDCPYEIPIEALMADKIASASKSEESSAERRRSFRRPSPHYSPRTMLVAQRESSTSSVKGTRSFRRGTPSGSVRKPRSWELIRHPKAECAMPMTKRRSEGWIPLRKESLVRKIRRWKKSIRRKREILKIGRAPEPSPLRSSQASVPDEPVELADRQSASRDGPSYDVSGVWPSRSLSPSS
ncbi:hypothetical protein PIB30_033875 [Stylosanthes scabra]|uniref:Uncharacterized protein n=1 Tax=Stylosanthes scabra TaxID=79078 RepID=A0ABU6TCC4_9FABA|nr:hypothetical protein [Stylosanthes scabra]